MTLRMISLFYERPRRSLRKEWKSMEIDSYKNVFQNAREVNGATSADLDEQAQVR